MQSDRRLVEDVHHADETGADLAGETDALGFTARKRFGTAIEREIIETDVAEEFQPIGHLAHDAGGDLAAPAFDRHGREKAACFGDRHRRDFRQRPARHEDVARGLVQPAAVTIDARTHAAELAEFLADGVRLSLAVTPLQIWQDAFPGVRALGNGTFRVEVAKLDLFFAAAPEQRVPHGFGQFVPRCFDVEAEVPGERLDQLEIIRVAPVPAANRATGEREPWIDDDSRRVEIFLHAEATAGAARAIRVVERKEPRFEPGQAVAADRAGVTVREQQRLALGCVLERHAGRPLCQPERGFERLGETLCGVGPHPQAIHDRIDRVPTARVERRPLLEFDQLAVDHRTHEALAA